MQEGPEWSWGEALRWARLLAARTVLQRPSAPSQSGSEQAGACLCRRSGLPLTQDAGLTWWLLAAGGGDTAFPQLCHLSC